MGDGQDVLQEAQDPTLRQEIWSGGLPAAVASHEVCPFLKFGGLSAGMQVVLAAV